MSISYRCSFTDYSMSGPEAQTIISSIWSVGDKITKFSERWWAMLQTLKIDRNKIEVDLTCGQ